MSILSAVNPVNLVNTVNAVKELPPSGGVAPATSDQSQALAMLVINGTFSAFGALASSVLVPSDKIICRPLRS
jgi:hypothetical protein